MEMMDVLKNRAEMAFHSSVVPPFQPIHGFTGLSAHLPPTGNLHGAPLCCLHPNALIAPTTSHAAQLPAWMLIVLPVFQNGGKVQHCQVTGPVQRPAGSEDQQCSSLQSGSHCDQHPPASGHPTQHDGPKLPPALQADL